MERQSPERWPAPCGAEEDAFPSDFEARSIRRENLLMRGTFRGLLDDDTAVETGCGRQGLLHPAVPGRLPGGDASVMTGDRLWEYSPCPFTLGERDDANGWPRASPG
jgi:hypothetical protein